jgi:hypothetical protein
VCRPAVMVLRFVSRLADSLPETPENLMTPDARNLTLIALARSRALDKKLSSQHVIYTAAGIECPEMSSFTDSLSLFRDAALKIETAVADSVLAPLNAAMDATTAALAPFRDEPYDVHIAPIFDLDKLIAVMKSEAWSTAGPLTTKALKKTYASTSVDVRLVRSRFSPVLQKYMDATVGNAADHLTQIDRVMAETAIVTLLGEFDGTPSSVTTAKALSSHAAHPLLPRFFSPHPGPATASTATATAVTCHWSLSPGRYVVV